MDIAYWVATFINAMILIYCCSKVDEMKKDNASLMSCICLNADKINHLHDKLNSIEFDIYKLKNDSYDMKIDIENFDFCQECHQDREEEKKLQKKLDKIEKIAHSAVESARYDGCKTVDTVSDRGK